MYAKGTWENLRAMCQAEGADLAVLKGSLHYQVVQYINSHPGNYDRMNVILAFDENYSLAEVFVIVSFCSTGCQSKLANKHVLISNVNG